MKKLATFALIFGLSTVTSAQTGWFVKGDLGYGKLTFKAPENSLKKSNFNQSIGVGYDYGNFRLSLDYTNNQKLKNKANTVNSSVKADLNVYQLGFNAIYSFANEGNIEPYVGARVTTNFIRSHLSVRKPGLVLDKSASETSTGYGALAGVEFKLNGNLNADVGVQYNYLGKVDNVKIQDVGVKTGLRYTF